jgi:hypothetical protein
MFNVHCRGAWGFHGGRWRGKMRRGCWHWRNKRLLPRGRLLRGVIEALLAGKLVLFWRLFNFSLQWKFCKLLRRFREFFRLLRRLCHGLRLCSLCGCGDSRFGNGVLSSEGREDVENGALVRDSCGRTGPGDGPGIRGLRLPGG